MQRLLCLCALIAPLAAQASDVKVSVRISGWWPFGFLERRYEPPVSPHHLGAALPPPPAKDACTFVAGVRHCPLPPRGEPR